MRHVFHVFLFQPRVAALCLLAVGACVFMGPAALGSGNPTRIWAAVALLAGGVGVWTLLYFVYGPNRCGYCLKTSR